MPTNRRDERRTAEVAEDRGDVRRTVEVAEDRRDVRTNRRDGTQHRELGWNRRSSTLAVEPVNEPLEAILESLDVKVDKEAHLQLT